MPQYTSEEKKMYLTRSQNQFLDTLRSGKSENEACELLGIKHITYDLYLKGLYRKFDVKNLPDLLSKVASGNGAEFKFTSELSDTPKSDAWNAMNDVQEFIQTLPHFDAKAVILQLLQLAQSANDISSSSPPSRQELLSGLAETVIEINKMCETNNVILGEFEADRDA